MDQLIKSRCRSDGAATFTGIEVDPGESLADTAAQSGVIDIRPVGKAEEALFHKFVLKRVSSLGTTKQWALEAKPRCWERLRCPRGVNVIVNYTVVDSPGVPPLTPVSLLKQVGAVIDLNSNTMGLKKIETTTTLRALPSRHVAHKLTEFAPGGWKAPTLEQTELYQVRTDVFRPVTLPGEFKPRSSKQCAGFSSGFVYTVRDRSHLSSSHQQHDPDLCGDDTMSSDFFSDDQVAMRKLCAGRRGSVAKTCSAVLGSRHPSVVADSAGIVATNFLKNRSDIVHSFAGTPGPSRQPVGLDGWTKNVGRHHELFPLSCIDRSQRGKGQDERNEERGYHDQPKGRTDCRGCLYQGERGHRMSEVRPRTSGLQHCFGTDSTLSWMEPRRNTVYADQSVPQRGPSSLEVAQYQPFRRWRFNEWFWWPRSTSKTRRWHTGSNSS